MKAFTSTGRDAVVNGRALVALAVAFFFLPFLVIGINAARRQILGSVCKIDPSSSVGSMSSRKPFDRSRTIILSWDGCRESDPRLKLLAAKLLRESAVPSDAALSPSSMDGTTEAAKHSAIPPSLVDLPANALRELSPSGGVAFRFHDEETDDDLDSVQPAGYASLPTLSRLDTSEFLGAPLFQSVRIGPRSSKSDLLSLEVELTDFALSHPDLVLARGGFSGSRGRLSVIAEDCGLGTLSPRRFLDSPQADQEAMHAAVDRLRIVGEPFDRYGVYEAVVDASASRLVWALCIAYLVSAALLGSMRLAMILNVAACMAAMMPVAIAGWAGKGYEPSLLLLPCIGYGLALCAGFTFINAYRRNIDEGVVYKPYLTTLRQVALPSMIFVLSANSLWLMQNMSIDARLAQFGRLGSLMTLTAMVGTTALTLCGLMVFGTNDRRRRSVGLQRGTQPGLIGFISQMIVDTRWIILPSAVAFMIACGLSGQSALPISGRSSLLTQNHVVPIDLEWMDQQGLVTTLADRLSWFTPFRHVVLAPTVVVGLVCGAFLVFAILPNFAALRRTLKLICWYGSALVPATLTASLLISLVGWAGHALDPGVGVVMATASVLSCVCALHLLRRIQVELKTEPSGRSAVIAAVARLFPPALQLFCALTASLAMFAFSPSQPLQSIGLWIAPAACACIVTTFAVLPALAATPFHRLALTTDAQDRTTRTVIYRADNERQSYRERTDSVKEHFQTAEDRSDSYRRTDAAHTHLPQRRGPYIGKERRASQDARDE
ncbi:MAG: hypothetical protein U0892_18145 [Pirellulales bacterium]